MSSKLIIESGSTKTNWVLLVDNKESLKAKSIGLNPTIMSIDDLYEAIEEGYNSLNFRDKIDEIVFYLAGLDSDLSREKLLKAFSSIFDYENLIVESDMLAACHALCGDQAGFVGILGTGSNCTFFDGVNMDKHIPSLGYLISDEGSGNQIGRRVIKRYFYNLIEPELKEKFQEEYNISKEELLENLYEHAMPNQYMAKFAPFAVDNQQFPSMHDIIFRELDLFTRMNLMTHPKAQEYPIHFVGSIALLTKDILKEVIDKYGLQLGDITKDPLPALIKYYQAKHETSKSG